MTFVKGDPDKRLFGVPRKVFTIVVLVSIGAAFVLLSKIRRSQPLPPTPTTAYFSYGSRQIPSVVPAAVEYPAPELDLVDLEGNPVSLGDLD